MQNHISFPSINQFRDVVKNVRSGAKYYGLPDPTIQFTGTVKLHGTNAAICRPVNGNADDIWAQSRERIITPTSDNAGFAIWAHSIRNNANRVFDVIRKTLKSVEADDVIQIFGEWCGGNIQSGVGLNGLPKTFVIFGVRVSKDSNSDNWLELPLERVADAFDQPNVYASTYFKTFKIDIDFAHPELSQNKLVELTNEVERNCPVAEVLWTLFTMQARPKDANTIGEGIVWEAWMPFGTNRSRLRFKVKGEKHSVTKTKTLAPVDVEKVATVAEFVDRTVTENRLKQGIEKLRETGLEVSQVNTGAFIKWVIGDILKEELDTLAESGLTTKDITSSVATKARNFFLNNLDD